MNPQDEATIYWTISDLEKIVDSIGSLQFVLLLASQYPKLFDKLNSGFTDYYDYVNDHLLFKVLKDYYEE